MATDFPADPASREVLLESESFRALRPRLVDQVFSCASERRYEPGEAVIRQGQQGGSLFVVIDGEARVLLSDHDRTVRTIATPPRGSVAGEVSLLTQEP